MEWRQAKFQKKIQNKDSEVDSASWKKNGGKD